MSNEELNKKFNGLAGKEKEIWEIIKDIPVLFVNDRKAETVEKLIKVLTKD